IKRVITAIGNAATRRVGKAIDVARFVRIKGDIPRDSIPRPIEVSVGVIFVSCDEEALSIERGTTIATDDTVDDVDPLDFRFHPIVQGAGGPGEMSGLPPVHV